MPNNMQQQIEQKKKSNLGLYIIAILLIAVLIGYIGYEKGFLKFNRGVQQQEEKKTNEPTKLDTKSRLVRSLYNEVTYDVASCEGLWEYTGGKRSNNEFIAKGTQEEIKMRLVYRLMSKSAARETDIANVPDYSTYSKVDINNPSQTSHYYSFNYVEGLYKQIFGSSAKIDEKIDIEADPAGHLVYKYDSTSKNYYPYYTDKEFTCNAGLESTLIEKAEQKDNIITIYQSAVYKEEGKAKENYFYVYKFEKEDDGLYKFVSRKVTEE